MKTRILAFAIALGMLAVSTSAQEPARPSVRTVTFSPDGKLLACGTGMPKKEGGFAVWEFATRKAMFERKTTQGVPSVAFSPDGNLLATGGYDNTAYIFDWKNKEELAALKHPDAVRSVCFSSNGELLVTGCFDKMVRLWNHADKKEVKSFGPTEKRVFGIDMSENGKLILAYAEGTAYLWGMDRDTPKAILTHPGSGVSCALVSPDGRWIVTGGHDGYTSIWDARESTVRCRYSVGGGSSGIAFCAKAGLLAISSFRNVSLVPISFADATADERKKIDALLIKLDDDAIQTREAAVKELVEMGLVAEPQLKQAAREAKSAEVRLRARKAREEMLSRTKTVLKCEDAEIDSAAISPDGKHVAGGGRDGYVYVWEVATGKLAFRLTPSR